MESVLYSILYIKKARQWVYNFIEIILTIFNNYNYE